VKDSEVKALLVTGVAGFIGSRVAQRLVGEGHHVVGVDDLTSGVLDNVPEGVEFIEADLALSSSLDRLPRNCEAILHLAGQSSGEVSFDDPVEDLSKNVVSTLNMIRFGIQNQVERLLYASSMAVYGPTPDVPITEEHDRMPISCYGVGKLAAENYLRVFQDALPSAALRMFNVYGPSQDLRNLRQGMVSIYLAQALDTGRIEVRGSMDRFRDFVYIDDVVDVWCRALHSDRILGRAVNVASGTRTTVRELLDEVIRLVPGAETVVADGTPGDQIGIYADVTRMHRDLGPVDLMPLEEGLGRFAKWAADGPHV
jgi:UDP-glucose 4-epimerase